jgi:membrane associated rhomboid family serine protease
VFRDGGSTVFTSFFLHAGILHLAGNLYFLLIFGSNVEDCLGRWRFVALVLLATVVGDMLHVIAQPHSTIPCVGASGGISGLIAFYALKFPRTQLDIMIRYRWVQIPAWGTFIVWVAMQSMGAMMQLAGFSNVAALAHIGGAMVGVLFWLGHRRELASATRVDDHSSEML